MLLSTASFDKENSPSLSKEYNSEINKDLVRVSTQKLRSIIKNSKTVYPQQKDNMAPGTIQVTSQNGESRSQGKVVLGLLPDDQKLRFKHTPKAPSIDRDKPVKDKNLLRRQKRVSFDSSPPQTMTGSDVVKTENEVKHDVPVKNLPENNRHSSDSHTTDTNVVLAKNGSVSMETEEFVLEPGQITREGTFTLSDSGEKSWNDDNMKEDEKERAKSASSHCSTCTCGRQSPKSPELKMKKIVSQHLPDMSEARQNSDVSETCVQKRGGVLGSSNNTRPLSRSAKTRIPKLTEEKRKINSAKSRGLSQENVDSEDKKSVLKRINQRESAWDDVKGELGQEPDNGLPVMCTQPAVRTKPLNYAISLKERRGLTLNAVPCPSCSEVHGTSSLQVDGEAERLPNPAELLLKIKRKHLRKRNLTDSIAAYVEECSPDGGAMTSRSDISSTKSSNAHRRAVTDAAHLERLKENVTLTLKRCTLTSANARMLAEDVSSAVGTAPQKTTPSVAIGSKDDGLVAFAQEQISEEKEERPLNETYSLSDYDQFLQMVKIHKPGSKREDSNKVTKQHYQKPLLSKRQVLALDFTNLESEALSGAEKQQTGETATGTHVIHGTGVIGTLDTSMANTMHDIPKCSRLPPISPVNKKGRVKVKVKVTPRSRSKKEGNSNLKEYDIKSIKRVEDLPPLVREELKKAARLRLRQLSSPIQSKGIERNH